MTSYMGLEPLKQFGPIRMKLSKPTHRQFTHYAVKLLHELLGNVSRINCPTPVGSHNIFFFVDVDICDTVQDVEAVFGLVSC